MPRAATTTDVFNAIAERRRREIIALLAVRARAVGDLVDALGLPQPAVSKHLGVLRKVGLVRVNRAGRQRVYTFDAEVLKPVHDWVKTCERLWSQQLDRVKHRAERRAAERLES
ncbi:MAG: winged helix-turn-helix transcriptional regulator [Phycisphaerales bacterium]|nr:winged helix-turn-helix transcriptional regulator [Phycisphaerales bacterium]